MMKLRMYAGKTVKFLHGYPTRGMAGGQLLLNMADPRDYHLFVLISIMISLALIPILVTVSKAPNLKGGCKY